MEKVKMHNKYDLFIMLLIISIVGGGSGGALEPIRLLSLFLIPVAFPLMKTRYDKNLKSFISFFIFWYVYMVVSLVWTSDINTGLKELIYYPIHFSLFLEIYVFSKKINNPMLTISQSWVFAFLITAVIGIWEINTGNHLSSSVQADSSMASGYGGISYHYNFAAVNFGNYNTYNTFICFCVPFILYLLNEKKKIYKVLSVIAILMGTYIVITNASRGALLSVIIMYFIYAILALKSNSSTGMKISFFVVALLLVVFLLFNWNQIAGFLLFRMENSDMVSDANRISLWSAAWSLFIDSFGLGTGVGSLNRSMLNVGHIIPHNAFLELLMQYGVVIFLIIFFYLFKLLLLFSRATDRMNKLFGYLVIVPMPIYQIIDSAYLLKPQLWLLMASVIVFGLNISKKRVNMFTNSSSTIK